MTRDVDENKKPGVISDEPTPFVTGRELIVHLREFIDDPHNIIVFKGKTSHRLDSDELSAEDVARFIRDRMAEWLGK